MSENYNEIDTTVVDEVKPEGDTSSSSSNDDKKTIEVCYICRRDETSAGKMVHMPGNICVCNDCLFVIVT